MSRDYKKRFWTSLVWNLTLVAMLVNMLFPVFEVLKYAQAQEVTPEPSPITEATSEVPPPATSEATAEATVEPTAAATTEETPVPTAEATAVVTDIATELPLPTLPPPTAEVSLFVDNFQDAGASLETNGWALSGGWSVANEPNSDGTTNFYLSAAPSGVIETAAVPQLQWGDLTLAARVRVGGSDSAGISVRAGVEGYTVVVNGNGFVQLYRGTVIVAEGPAVVVDEILPVTDGTPEATAPAAWRTVNIAAQGDTLTVLLDGVEQIVYVDPTPLGAGTFTFSAGALNTGTTDFDDIYVTRLLPPVVPTVEVTVEATEEAVVDDGESDGVLINEDFEGDLSAWTSSNPDMGTVAAEEGNHVLLMPSGATLTPAETLVVGDFRLDVRFSLVTAENGGVQITLRDGYTLTITTTETTLARGETVLSSSTTTHDVGVWHSLSVTLERDHIVVSVNGTAEIDLVDPEPTLAGGIGFTALGAAMLDDVVVTDLTSQAVLAEVTASPTPVGIDEAAAAKLDGAIISVLTPILGGDEAAFRELAAAYSMYVDDVGRLRVEIRAANFANGETLRVSIEGTGGVVERVIDNTVTALVPPMGIIALAGTDEVEVILVPFVPVSTDYSNSVSEAVGSVVPQSLDIIASNDWDLAGIRGANVDIAVIDSVSGGFIGSAAGAGAGGGNQQCLYGVEAGSLGSHGSNVVDVLCDIAPNSRVFGYLATDAADLTTTINNLVATTNLAGITNNTFDIILITLDMGVHTSAGDGTGVGLAAGNNFYSAITAARNAGILVIASAGNNGDGTINAGDPAVRYGSFSLNNGQSATVSITGVAGSRVNISWSAWSTTADISATLDGSPKPARGSGVPGHSFATTAGAHSLVVNNTSGATQTIQVQVTGAGSNITASTVVFATIAGTLARPADSPDALAVGAVCANQAARYPRLVDSSVGPAFGAGGVLPGALPTAGDQIKPDVVAPSHVNTQFLSANNCNLPAAVGVPNLANPTDGFNGTSAAAAHVAGMAALLRSNTINNSMNARFGPGLVSAPAALENYLQTHTVDAFDTTTTNQAPPTEGIPTGTADGWDRTYGAGLVMLGSPTFDMSTVQNFGDANPIVAGTFYVGQANLASTQTGTSADPYLSIAEAIANHAGQRIVVMPGEYMGGVNLSTNGTSVLSYDAADIVNRPDTAIWVNDSYSTSTSFGIATGGFTINNVDTVTIDGFVFSSAHPLYIGTGPAPLFLPPRAIDVTAASGTTLRNNIFNDFTTSIKLLVDGAATVVNNTFSDFVLPQGSFDSSVVLSVAGMYSSGGTVPVNIQRNTFNNNIVNGSSQNDNLPRQAIVYLGYGQFNFYSNRMYSNNAEAMVSVNQWQDFNEVGNNNISIAEVRIFSSAFTNNQIVNSDALSIINIFQGAQLRFVNNTVAGTNFSLGARGSFITLGGTSSIANHFNGVVGPIHEFEIHNNVFYNNLFAGGGTSRNLVAFTNGAINLGCFNFAGVNNQGAHNNWFVYTDFSATVPGAIPDGNRPDQGQCRDAVSDGTNGINGNIFEEIQTTTAQATFESTNFFGAATDPIDPYRLRPTSTVGVDGGNDTYVTGIFTNPVPPPAGIAPDALGLTRIINRIGAGAPDIDLGAYELSDPQPLVVSGAQTVNTTEDPANGYVNFVLGSGVVTGGILPLRFTITSQPTNYNASATSPCSGIPVQYDAVSNQAAYCPPPDFYTFPPSGVVSFTYAVTDALGEASATGTVNINLSAVNDSSTGTTFGTVGSPQVVFTDVLTPTNYRLRPYVDFNNFRLSDPTNERGQDYQFTFSGAAFVSGSPTLLGPDQASTVAALNAALTAANSNGGFLVVDPIPGNTGELIFSYSVTDGFGESFPASGFVRLIVTQRLAGIGLHDDVSLDFVFSNGWSPLYFETANNNSMHYTSVVDEQIDFYFSGDTFILNLLGLTAGGNIEVTIDPDGDGGQGFQTPQALGLTCTPEVNAATGYISSMRTVTAFFSAGCRGLDTTFSGTVHILRIKHKSAGLFTLIDSIEIRGASLPAGYYEERDFSLTYTGTWYDLIAVGPKGGSERYTNVLGSNITFQYDAAGSDAIVLYYTAAPGWGQLRICATGGGCQIINQNSTTARYGLREWLSDTELGIGGSTGTHTITMTPISGGVFVGIEALYIHSQPNALGTPLAASPTIYEDTNAALYYIGTWSFFGAAQAVGGSARSTTDPSASVMFNIDSSAYGVAVYRTSGTGISNMEICINENCQIFSSAGSAVYGDTAVMRLASAGPHVVEIRNTSAAFFDIEAIRVLTSAGPLGLGFYEETESATDFNLTYSGAWSNLVVPSLIGGSGRLSTSSAASITFQIDAGVVKRIGIYRIQVAGWSNFNVCASGGTCQTIINNSSNTALGRLAIVTTDSLGIGSSTLIHTITITPTTNGLPVTIEALELRGVQGPLAAGYYEEKQVESNLNLFFNGTWVDSTTSGPRGGAYRYATTTSANISFQYNGAVADGIVVYHPVGAGFGTLNVCNGANCVPINQSATTLQWARRTWIPNSAIGNPGGVVTITMTPGTNGPFVGVEAIYIHDAVNGFGTLAPNATPYEETDSALRYVGTWTSLTSASTVGGTSQYTVDPSGSIMFNIDAAARGVAVYRTAGSGWNGVEICIDAVCQTFGARTTATIYGDSVSSRTTVAGPHVVEIRNISAATLNIEAIQILGPTTPLGIGYYEDREVTANFNMTYTGNWNFFNIAGMAGGDAHYATTTASQLSFQIDTAVVKRIVLFRTTAPSGWANIDVCGVQCFPVNNVSTTALYGQAQVITLANLNLPATGTHTITIDGATDGFIDIEAIQLVGGVGPLAPGYYDATESGALYNLNFSGTWTSFIGAGPRGSTERYASSTSSEAEFTYDSTNSDGILVYFTKSAGRGGLQVCGAICLATPIDQSSVTTMYAQRRWITEAELGITTGTHTITLSPATNGLVAGVDALYIHGNNSIGAPLSINGTPYQETNSSLRYVGTWSSFAFASVSGGTAAYTFDPSAAVMFNIDNAAAGVAVFRTITSAGGPTEVCVDNTCQTFSGAGPTVFSDTAALYRGGIGAGQHFVEIRSVSAAQTIVEAVQVVSGVTPLAIGYYEETEQATAFNINYAGAWTTWSGGLLGGTGRYTVSSAATLTFRVDPTAMDRIVIYHSMGSGYGTLNVCSDTQGAFGGGCTTINTNSATARYGVAAIVTKAQLGIAGAPTPHTITVNPTTNAFVSIEALQILGVPGPLGIGYYEETGISTSFNLSYSGAWLDFITPLVLGGSAVYTTSNTAEARFSINAATVTRLAVFRTTGPGWGNLQVCHGSGTPCVTVPNSGTAVTYGVPFLIDTSTLGAGTFEVVIKGVTNGVAVDIEALQLLGPAGNLTAGYYEETEASSNFGLTYSGAWTNLAALGPRGGTMRYASTTASTVTFSYDATNSDGIVIYHPAGAAWGTMQVCNGANCHNINQATGTIWNNRTWVREDQIGNPAGVVTITLRPSANGPIVGFDAIYIHGNNSIGTPLTVSPTPYEENDPALRYIGTWSTVAAAQYFGGTARFSSDPSSSILFNVAAGAYGVAVYRTSGAGSSAITICIDDSCQTFTPTASTAYGDVIFFRSTNGPHVVEIRTAGTATSTIIEAIRVLGEQDVLTPGFYQETDPNLIYTGTWTSLSIPSFNGGTARYTTSANDELSFKIGGGTTGFSVFVTRSVGAPNLEVCYQPTLPALGTEVCTTEPTNYTATQFTYGFATFGLNNKQLAPNQANDQVYNVTIRHAGTNGQWIAIEAIAVLGVPTTTLTAGTYDDTEAALIYAPAPLWYAGSAAGYLGNTWHFAVNAGTTVQLRFTGNSITMFQLAAAGFTANVNACLVIPVTTGNQVACANFSQSAGVSTFATPITVYGFGFGTHDIVLESQTNAPFSVDTIQIR